LASHRRPAFSPAHTQLIEGEVIAPGLAEDLDGAIIYEDGTDEFVAGDCCGGIGCPTCLTIPSLTVCLDNLEISAGAHGFTGPVNRGQTASFGFHSGFNWGIPIDLLGGGLAAQLGLNGNFSNFSGAEFTDDKRNQLFVTGGLFRRVDWGLQGGVVFDYLHDDWYATYDVTQIRGELSWVYPCTHELGFWFTTSTRKDTALSTFSGNLGTATEVFEGTDLYAFFYRFRATDYAGATARVYAGWTGDSDGLIGADVRLPISCDWAVEGTFTYLVPEEAAGTVGRGHAQESWNVAVGIVWYPGTQTSYGNNYFRPLMRAADNGSFMVGRR